MTARSSHLVVYAALGGNVAVALTKFAAAAWTGSSAMLSEGVHSLVDSGNQALLLYGMWRAEKPADAQHPLGHGRELYFWSFVVSVLIFALGSGVAFYEGVSHLRHPVPASDTRVIYVVLLLSAIFESVSWWAAFREFRGEIDERGFLEAAMRSKDPTRFLVLFEDSAALLGIAFAFLGTLGAQLLDMPILDGVASIFIAALLAATAAFLARESKGLLIGETARQSLTRDVSKVAIEQDGVVGAFNVITVHMAPQQVVVALNIEFMDCMSAPRIEHAVAEIERRLKERHEDVVALFVKPAVAGHQDGSTG